MLKLKSFYEPIYRFQTKIIREPPVSQIGLVWFVSMFGLFLDGCAAPQNINISTKT